MEVVKHALAWWYCCGQLWYQSLRTERGTRIRNITKCSDHCFFNMIVYGKQLQIAYGQRRGSRIVTWPLEAVLWMTSKMVRLRG